MVPAMLFIEFQSTNNAQLLWLLIDLGYKSIPDTYVIIIAQFTMKTLLFVLFLLGLAMQFQIKADECPESKQV